MYYGGLSFAFSMQSFQIIFTFMFGSHSHQTTTKQNTTLNCFVAMAFYGYRNSCCCGCFGDKKKWKWKILRTNGKKQGMKKKESSPQIGYLFFSLIYLPNHPSNKHKWSHACAEFYFVIAFNTNIHQQQQHKCIYKMNFHVTTTFSAIGICLYEKKIG